MTMLRRFLILALLTLWHSIPSWACVGSGDDSSYKAHYGTQTFSGEAHFGKQTDVTIDSGFVFRLVPTYTGWAMVLLNNGEAYPIEKKDDFIEVSNVNEKSVGRELPFGFNTLSHDGLLATEIALGKVSSEADRKAALAELDKFFKGYGILRVRDVKIERGISRGLEYSKIIYLKFEGDIKYPTGISVSFCAQ